MRRARREAKEAALARLTELSWDGEDLEGRPTQEIVTTLAALGIEANEERFREWVNAHGKVEAIAGIWEQGKALPRKWEDYPYLAARALWACWAPDVYSPEVLLEQHLPEAAFQEYEPSTPEDGQTHWGMAQAVMDLVAPPGAPPRPALLDELCEIGDCDLSWWLDMLPLARASPRVGMVDEAVELCRRMAPVYGAENSLGDRAVILAENGRREEALRQVEQNLQQFPEDVWIRIKAGDACKALGELARAEALYRQAYDMTDASRSSYDRDGAVERLLDLLEETGREEEREALVGAEQALDAAWERGDPFEPSEDEEWDEDDEGGRVEDEEDTESVVLAPGPPSSPPPATFPSTVRHAGPKVGRNDPCPCGSGKKYKRCCGR